MTVIGSASIDIRANDRYFEPDVRRAVSKIKDVKIDLRVNADMAAANKKLRDLRYRMSKQEVSIKIRANDVAFDADVRAAIRKIKNVGIDLKVDADISAASKKIRDLRYRTTQNEIKIPIRANDVNFEKDVRAATRKIRNVTIDLKADVDVAKASKKIRDLRYRITSKDAILKVDANVAKAEEKMRKFLEKFINTDVNIHAKAHTGAANTALSELQARYGGAVNFTAKANTTVARAALAHAARTRHAKIMASIDPKSMAAIKGAFSVLSGTLPFDKVKASIFGVIANFEGLAVKVGLVSTALLSVGAVALTAGANIFSIGGDITEVVGIAAMLPAAFIAMGTAIAANKMAWKGFGEALSSDPKKAAAAMAELPPKAQEAADAVRGLGTEIQKATQVKFWDALGTSLQDMVTNLLPQLKEGFGYVGESLGVFEAATFNGISSAFGDGVLLGILTNIGDMFKNMTAGVGDFIQGLATLGRVGSTYLPQLGTSLAEAGVQFGEFIRQADEAGEITEWIDTSIRRFQELGSIVKSTTNIMSGLTEIARLSGAPGLTEMADGFRNVAEVVNSEPFQSQLRTILEGARAGTEALGAGLGTLTELFWDSSESIGSFLKLAGEIAGLTFGNITALFDGTGLGSGLYAALMGLKDGMGVLKPGFRDLGIAVGDLGFIAAEMFRSLAPGLNILAETISDVIAGLKDGIIDALPALNTFMQAVLTVASGPLVALAEAVGNILTTFSELPGVVQTAIMSLGLFLLLKPKFAKFFGGMADSLRKETSVIGNTYRDLKTNATDTSALLRQDMSNVGTSIRTVMTETGNAAKTAAGRVTGVFGSMATSLRNTMAPLGKAIGNSLMDDGGMERVKTGFNDMRYNAATNFAAISAAASMNAQTVRGKFEDAAQRAGTAFVDMSGSAKRGLGAASTAAQEHMRTMAVAVDRHLGNISPSAQKAFNSMSLGAAAAGSMAGQHIGNMASSIDGHLGKISPSAQQAFRGMSTFALSAKDVAGGHISSMANTIDGHLGRISPSAQKAFNTMGLNAQAGAMLAKTAIASVPEHARTAATGVSTAFSRVGDGFKAIGTKAADAAKGVHGALAPARKAFSDLATHATTAGVTAGRGFSSGVSSGVGGLGAALGGGWGIALMGATVALGAYAQKAAESKARVEELTGALQSQGGAWSGVSEDMLAANMLDGATNAWDDFYRGVVFQSKSVEESFSQLGISAKDVSKELANSEGRDKYLEGWGKIQDALRDGKPITDEMAAAIGSTSDAFDDMSAASFTHVMDEVEGVGEEAVKAEARAKALGEQFGTSSILSQRLASNYDVLESATSSVSEKFAALKDNMDILNKGTMTADNASKNYHQTLDDTAAAIDQIAANGVAVTSLYDTAKGFDMASQAGRDLHTALGGSADAILTTAMTAFQAARDGGAEMGAAQETAMNAINAPLASFRQSLAALGFAPAQIDGIVASFGLIPDEIRTALNVDSEDAIAETTRAKLMMDAIVEGNYEMVLTALPEEAKAALSETMDLGDAFAKGEYETILKALDQTEGGRQAAVLALASYEDGEWLTYLKAKNLVPEEVAKANAAAQALMPEANIDIVAQDLASGILDNVEAYPLNGKVVEMTGNDLVSEILATVNSSNLMDKDSKLTTKDLVTQSIDELNAKQLNGKISNLEAADLASKVMQDVNALTMDGKVSTLTADDLASLVLLNLNEVEFNDKEAEVTLRDGTKPGADSAKETVNSAIGGMGGGMSRGATGQIVVPIEALDGTAPAVESAQGTMGNLTNVFRGLFGINSTAPATGEAQGTMGTLSDVWRGLFASDNTAPATGAAQGTMGTLQSVMRDLQAQDTTGGATGAAQGTMNSLRSVMRDLQAQNTTGGATGAAQGTMNTLRDVIRNLEAQNRTGGATGSAQGTMEGLRDVERELRARNRAGEGVNAAQGVINSLVGKTVDVVTRFFKIGDNADGGLWSGDGTRVMAQGGIMKDAGNTAVQAFANGGITRGAQQQAVKAFAGGGIENHTAQIARGAWPVRIWAEPETGGEAYIPLSPNKRKRSLAILKEVMAEFGLEHLTHSFADGGLNKASRAATPKVISSRYAAASVGSTTPVAQSNTQMAAPIINVHPSQGLNEEQIGVIASDRLWFNIQNSIF